MDFSVGSVFASLIVSTAGFGLFRYGKRAEREPQFIAGIALMVFPMFVPGVAWMVTIAVALLAAMLVALRAGY